MLKKRINLYPYIEDIKRAANKEDGIKKVLRELDINCSLTKTDELSIIEWLECYFQNEERKLQENFSIEKEFPCKGGFEYKLPPMRATDNSEILDALKNLKEIY